LPTEESVRTALRTQQILAHESGAADTTDPLAGSYYVESLTDTLEEQATELLDEIDQRGGMRSAVESGWVQRQIQETAFQRQEEIETGERVIVGVNRFQSEDAERSESLEEVSEAEANSQRDAVEDLRERRDTETVEQRLETLAAACADGENVMPHIVAAVKAYATVGEISDTMREEFGEYSG
jgi:methylmalonyl-CoA mutase N-terminal domain/subunit